MAAKTPEQITEDLLRPLGGASARYWSVLAFFARHRGRGALRFCLAGL